MIFHEKFFYKFQNSFILKIRIEYLNITNFNNFNCIIKNSEINKEIILK